MPSRCKIDNTTLYLTRQMSVRDISSVILTLDVDINTPMIHSTYFQADTPIRSEHDLLVSTCALTWLILPVVYACLKG